MEHVEICISDESTKNEAEFCRRVASGRKVGGALKSLVNSRNLRLEVQGCYITVSLRLFYVREGKGKIYDWGRTALRACWVEAK